MPKSVHNFLKKENTPMCQATYWVVYLATGLIMVLKTVEASAHSSYELISIFPQLGQYSGLVQGIFM